MRWCQRLSLRNQVYEALCLPQAVSTAPKYLLQGMVGLTDISVLSTCCRLDNAFIWQMSVKRFSTA